MEPEDQSTADDVGFAVEAVMGLGTDTARAAAGGSRDTALSPETWRGSARMGNDRTWHLAGNEVVRDSHLRVRCGLGDGQYLTGRETGKTWMRAGTLALV